MPNTTKTHGIVGKSWSFKGQIINIEAVDQVELTVDAIERSFTFHEQRDFDAFMRELRPVSQAPTVAPSSVSQRATTIKVEPVTKPAARNLRPVVPAPAVEETLPAISQPPPAERRPATLDTNGLSVPDIDSADPLAYMKGVLMESMERLRKDKTYIGQAKEITNAANSFVGMAVLEMKIRKGV